MRYTIPFIHYKHSLLSQVIMSLPGVWAKLLALQYKEHSLLGELTTKCTKVIKLVKSSSIYANVCGQGR